MGEGSLHHVGASYQTQVPRVSVLTCWVTLMAPWYFDFCDLFISVNIILSSFIRACCSIRFYSFHNSHPVVHNTFYLSLSYRSLGSFIIFRQKFRSPFYVLGQSSVTVLCIQPLKCLLKVLFSSPLGTHSMVTSGSFGSCVPVFWTPATVVPPM